MLLCGPKDSAKATLPIPFTLKNYNFSQNIIMHEQFFGKILKINLRFVGW